MPADLSSSAIAEKNYHMPFLTLQCFVDNEISRYWRLIIYGIIISEAIGISVLLQLNSRAQNFDTFIFRRIQI